MIHSEIRLRIPESTLTAWQEIVDLLAEIVDVPVSLIMRYDDPDIAVLVSSHGGGNPYHPGDKEQVWGSGLYCETVIKTREKLLVPNALADARWRENPDAGRNMISYLGFPILLPDQQPFGTLCVLDDKENPYTEKIGKLMSKLRTLVESDLETIYVNQVLGDKNRRLTDYLMELQAFRGLVTICANCKRIRDEKGEWHPIENFLIRHPEADFSHDICPVCLKKLYTNKNSGVR